MKLDAMKFGIASALTAAVLWIACTLLVWALPLAMTAMGGHMMHMNPTAMGWVLSAYGVIVGGVAWIVVAGITGWLLATFYNRLQR